MTVPVPSRYGVGNSLCHGSHKDISTVKNTPNQVGGHLHDTPRKPHSMHLKTLKNEVFGKRLPVSHQALHPAPPNLDSHMRTGFIICHTLSPSAVNPKT